MAAPTGYSSLGLIGFTDKGDYVAATTYVQNDLCHYNGKIWKSKVDDNTGHTPASGAYWDIWVDPSDSLEEMTDVDISSPANGDVLEYDSTSGKWKNSDVIGEVKQALSDEAEVRAEYTVHNFLDVLGSTKTNVSVSSANNRVITNTATDTKSVLSLTFTFKYSDETSSSPIWQDVSGTGEKTFTITANKDVTEVVFSHNGSVRNIGFKTSCSLKAGSYILSFSITSNDPTTVGGLVIEKAMLADAKDPYTGYTPYAPTNAECLSADVNAELGAHNFTKPLKSQTNSTYGITISTDSNDVSTISGTALSSGGRLSMISERFTLKAGTYKILKEVSDTSVTTDITIHDNNNNALGWTGGQPIFTISQDTVCFIGLNVLSGKVYSNVKLKVLVKLAIDPSTKFTPYAMTNKELTDVANSLKNLPYIEGTTTSSGNLDANLTLNEKNVIAAFGSGLIALPYFTFENGANHWWFHVENIDGTPKASSSVKIYYIAVDV